MIEGSDRKDGVARDPGGSVEAQQPVSLVDEPVVEGTGPSGDVRQGVRKGREDVLALLRQMPGVVSAARKLAADGKIYRALVTRENVHLLREIAKGIVRFSLRGAQGRFVENVDLLPVPSDIAGALASIALQALLTEISAKLAATARGIDDPR